MRGHVTGTSHSDSHPRLWMTVERSVSAKFAKMTWRSEWMPHLEKFSKNALWASSSRNRRERGAESEDEEASERWGFQARVDLCLGAMDTTNVNRKKGRERKTIRKVPSNCIMGSAQSKPISTQTVCTHLNAWQYYYNANVMQCMRF